MNVLLLVALKKIHDDQQAAARRRRRANEEARRKRNAPKDKAHQYSSRQYSENEYFNLVVSEDEILTSFFKALEQKGNEIDDRDAEEVRKVIEEKLKLQAGRVEEINKTLEEIKESGLDLDTTHEEYFYYKTTVGQKVLYSGEPAFGGKGEYSKAKKSFQISYKGIHLAKEWFDEGRIDENPFDVRLTDWEQRNPEIDSKIEEKEAEIGASERKLKYALFGKEEKEDNLRKLKEELERLKEEKVRGDNLRVQKETFDEITPEQKVLLAKYFTQTEECRSAGKDVDQDIEEYLKIKGESSRYYEVERSAVERNKWQRVIDELIKDGDASEELFDAVDAILAEEEIGYEKYSIGKDSYQMGREGYSAQFIKIIGWYLDTRREKIALKGVERREQAYSALAKEHKKLLELSGLVDEAKALEEAGKNPNDPKDVKGDEEYGDE